MGEARGEVDGVEGEGTTTILARAVSNRAGSIEFGRDEASSGPKRDSQSCRASRLMGNSKSSEADVNGRKVSVGFCFRISAATS